MCQQRERCTPRHAQAKGAGLSAVRSLLGSDHSDLGMNLTDTELTQCLSLVGVGKPCGLQQRRAAVRGGPGDSGCSKRTGQLTSPLLWRGTTLTARVRTSASPIGHTAAAQRQGAAAAAARATHLALEDVAQVAPGEGGV